MPVLPLPPQPYPSQRTAAAQNVSTHWLRHTTLTWVERHFGYAVTRAYAGHSGKNDAGTTTTYVRADVYEGTFDALGLHKQFHAARRVLELDHPGISGCSAGSPESFAATATFFIVAIVVTFGVHLLTGGAV